MATASNKVEFDSGFSWGDVFHHALYSEFVWGIILGIVLTYLGSILTLRMTQKSQKFTVVRFCEDSISNICEYISSMDQHRDRARHIHYDFLELIDVEIGVYGRNREHLIHIENKNLRKEIRDFYTDVAIQIVKIKNSLSLFYEANKLAQQEVDGSPERRVHQTSADQSLGQAHIACDRLVAVARRKTEIFDQLL